MLPIFYSTLSGEAYLFDSAVRIYQGGIFLFNRLLFVVLFFSFNGALAQTSFQSNYLLDGQLFNSTQPSAAGSYYDQFIFRVLGECKNPSKLWFHQTHSWEAALIGRDEKNRPIEAWLSIQLFDDGTYWAEYGEHAK